MEETSREQQREARRLKVLARSHGDHRATVTDLATSQNEMAPEGASAELDQDGVEPSSLLGDNNAAGAAPVGSEDNNKSASRLAAERRRQRILSKSSERMAKVQGCLLYTSPSPRDKRQSRMPSSA